MTAFDLDAERSASRPASETLTTAALTALRVMTGLLFVQHGLIKLTGFPAGAQPGQQALLSLFGVGGAIELVAGLLILAGLFTRPAAFLLAGQMAVAYFLYHAPRGFFPALNGGIPAILYCFILLYLAAAGAGRWSLDARRTARS